MKPVARKLDPALEAYIRALADMMADRDIQRIYGRKPEDSAHEDRQPPVRQGRTAAL